MALDKNNAKLTDNEADKVNGGFDFASLVWECKDCGNVSQSYVTVCPKCGSSNILEQYQTIHYDD